MNKSEKTRSHHTMKSKFGGEGRTRVGRCHWDRLRKKLPLGVGLGRMGRVEEGPEGTRGENIAMWRCV